MGRIQIDLINLTLCSVDNDNFCWGFNAINVYSKFAFYYALKTNSIIKVIKCIKDIL